MQTTSTGSSQDKTAESSSENWEQRLDQALREVRFPTPEAPPEELFHYTNGEALHSIVKCGVIHATHVRFLTDATEIRYGLSLLQEVLHKVFKNWQTKRRKILEDTLIGMASAGNGDAPPVFVACFTPRGDDVTQWDRYGGDAGYALGFDLSDTSKGFRLAKSWGSLSSAALVKVVYRRRNQRALFEALLRPALRLLHEYKESEDAEFMQACAILSHHLAWPLMEALVRCKDPAFSAEREWRLVFTEGPAVVRSLSKVSKVKVTNRGLTPFIVLEPYELDGLMGGKRTPLPLTSVVHGPNLRPEAPQATRAFLEQQGYYCPPWSKRNEIPTKIWESLPERKVWLKTTALR